MACRPLSFITLCLLLLAPAVQAEDSSASVEALFGKVWAQDTAATERQLKKKSHVIENEQVRTESRAWVRLVFSDGSKLNLGPASSMKVVKYQYNAPEEGLETKILKGTFRFISGHLAKKKPASVKVKTPVATIGIRGTDFIGEVTETSAKIVLQKPEKGDQKTAIEVYNEFGSVVIDQPGYGTEIPDKYSPPSPPRRMALRNVNNIMRSMQKISAPRMRR